VIKAKVFSQEIGLKFSKKVGIFSKNDYFSIKRSSLFAWGSWCSVLLR